MPGIRDHPFGHAPAPLLEWGVASFVRLLGRPGIRDGTRASEPPAGKTTALLYHLAYRRDWVTREELLGLLYPETDEPRARQNLRALVAKVRRSRWAGGVAIEAGRLRWDVPTDVEAFETALEERRLSAAVELYRGPLLAGFVLARGEAYQAWLQLEREALARRWREAALALGSTLVEQGRHLEAGEVAARLVAADPLDEPAVRMRLVSLSGSGDRPGALQAYQGFSYRLREELGVEPEAETAELVERLRSGDALPGLGAKAPPDSAAAAASLAAPPPRRALPRALVTFVGRTRELALLHERLEGPDCRLITLVGPGGMGKTALALELGRSLEEEGREVVFVPLEAVADVDAAIAIIGDAVGMTFFGAASRREQLLSALAPRRALVIVDNVEQIAGTGELLTAMLKRSPDVRLLAVSRERLGVQAECVVEVDGLRVEGGARSEAARLFEEAARRAHSGFEVGRDAEAVNRICRLVGGMPLALELAAGWSPVLGAREIAERLESGLQLLRAHALDRPARHGDVRTVLQASWARLDGAEQRALADLAVFAGGFTERAAKAVADVDAFMLLRLNRGALVRREEGDRFGQHALVWRYARERAREDRRAWALVRARHATHFAERMAKVAALAADRPDELRPEEAQELSNVLEAWVWMRENGRRDLLDRTLEGLFELARVTQRQPEVGRYIMDAAESLGDGSALHGRLLRAVGTLRIWAADFDGALGPLRRSVRIAQKRADRTEEALARFQLAMAGAFGGEAADHQRSAWERCVALFQELGDGYHEARALVNLAAAEAEPQRREALERTAVRRFRECEGHYGLTLALHNLALTVAEGRGTYVAARELLDEAVAVEREHGEPFRLAWWLADRAAVLLDLGRTDAAERDVEEAERVAAELGPGFGVWEADHALLERGRLRLARGDPEGAADVLGRVASDVSRLPDPFGRKREARCWWALAEARAGRTEAAKRVASAALAAGSPEESVRERGCWPEAAIAARVLADVCAAAGDVFEASAALRPALEVVGRSRLLPAALELCVGAASVSAARGEPDVARSLLTLVSRHPAAAAHARSDAAARLAELGGRAAEDGPRTDPVGLDAILEALGAGLAA